MSAIANFPADPLPIKSELLINGTWTDITSRVRLEDQIQISRGYLNEQGNNVTSDTAAFTINNRDGLFSDGNPLSPYYGLLGQNTQCRHSVVTSPAITDTFTRTVTGTGDWGTSNTGNVWAGIGAGGSILGTDFAVTGTEATHSVPTTNAYRFCYIPTYNDINVTVQCTFKVPLATVGNLEPCGIMLRGTSTTSYVTLRVEVTPTNTVLLRFVDRDGTIFGSFSTGITHTGTGQPITVKAQADGHFLRGKAWVASGTEPDWITYHLDETPVSGFIGIRSGVSPTNTNAKPVVFTYDNFSAMSQDFRFWGEIPEFPQYWDTSGKDIYVPTVASDIIRRITQGAQPLASPIYRYLSNRTGLTGYWPFEDAGSATQAGSAIPGAQAATINDLNFGFDETLPGSAGVGKVNSTASIMRGAAANTAAGTYAAAIWMFKYDVAPVGSVTIMDVIGDGTVKRWNVTVTGTTFVISAYDKDDNLLNTSAVGFGTGVSPAQWITMRLQIHVVAGNIAMELGWSRLGQGVAWGTGNNAFVAGSNVGRFLNWRVPIGSGSVNLSFAHMAIATAPISNSDGGFLMATNAYFGEFPDDRMSRICNENGIKLSVMRTRAEVIAGGIQEPMGYQPIGKLIDIISECAAVDGGFLGSGRDFFGIVYRSRNTLYAQSSLALSYSAEHFSGQLRPTNDDQTLRNDVTINQPNGSSGRSIRTDGRKGTQPPPIGSGTYDTSYELNSGVVARLASLAQQATFIGTWDELRWPTVQLKLERACFVNSLSLTTGIRTLDMGDPFLIKNQPAWLPPDDAEVMVRGWREILGNRTWSFTFNTQPYGPFRAVNNMIPGGKGRYRVAAATSIVKTGFSSSATSFTVTTATGAPWVNSAGKPAVFPILVKIAGEVMSVGAISARSSGDQTFSSVTRSVNGVVKAQLANAPVQVVELHYASL
jgi:hypothetical protein